MKLKNVLIVVKDIEKSKQFYHDLFGLEMILDNDGNMILTEGLVLQEEKYWKNFLGQEIIPEKCTGILKLLQLVRIIYNIIQSRRTHYVSSLQQ